MLIGIFSFVRMLYLAYEHFWTSDGDIRPSQGTKPRYKIGNIEEKPRGWYRRVKWNLELFSVALVGDNGKKEPKRSNSSAIEKEVERTEAIRRQWSIPQRCIIIWLPWLSLVYFWPWKNEIQQLQVEGFTDDDGTSLLERSKSDGKTKTDPDDAA